METIRILFYTDSCAVSKNLHRRGLTLLEHFIKLKLAAVADIRINILNRHIDYSTGEWKYRATKLTNSLLGQYDELWIFGVLQAASQNPELTKTEIRDLTEWMKTGGVLITGDHSDPMEESNREDPRETFVNLGSALGRNIPRAGELRVWDGPPTGRYDGPLQLRDNFNTQEGNDPNKLDDPSLQLDKLPQKLYLIPPDNPHRLFWWYFDQTTQHMVHIKRFPDHLHEGKLAYPDISGKDWPHGSPSPTLVAQGRDKRFKDKPIDLVSVFEGTKEVGRIVADSSFHHYMNINLFRIDGRDANGVPKPYSDLDQIAQYYANLAIWLAPRQIRQRMAWNLFFLAAQHPEVREDRSNPTHILGRTALRIVQEDIGISNIYRLIEETDDEAETKAIADLVALIFIEKPIHDRLKVNSAEALGAIVRAYQHSFDELRVLDPSCLQRDPNPPEIVFRGLNNALGNVPELLDELLPRYKAATAALAK